MTSRIGLAIRTIRLAALLGVVVLLAFAAPRAQGKPRPADLSADLGAGDMAAGRKLIAEDNFDGSTLNPANWVPYNGNSTNDISHWTPQALTVGGGELQIHTHGKNPTGAGNYSGAVAWCLGAGNQTYGLWMVRARFDAGAGYGPAILLWPQSNDWPKNGEIDLVESIQPSRDTALSSIHWGDTAPGHRESGALRGDYTQWHVFAVDWEPTFVKISIDGTTVYDTRYSSLHPVIPSTPMHIVIQQEPGPYGGAGWIGPPNSSTPNDVLVHVDWVRIYK
jgi:endo-1,3-1,4-beta-glycanase ExoK